MSQDKIDKDMEKHANEIQNIRTDMNIFKSFVKTQFEDFSKKLEPQFTKVQVTTVMFMMLTYMVSVMLYITDMKSDNRNNTTEVEHLKESKRVQEAQFQSIMNVLSTIKTDVEVLKSKDN